MRAAPPSEVRFPGHGGEPVAGHLARPAGARPAPAVVLVHGIGGFDDHIRAVARRFAEEGFAALAPDLGERDRGRGFPQGTGDPAAPREPVAAPPDARIAGDLAGAARYLSTLPGVRRGAVGAVGFGAGGTWAFHLACERTAPIKACVDFYGPLRRDPATPEKPKGNLDRVHELCCPLLGIFGAKDELIPLADVLALKEALGGRGAVIAYPRAGHGFHDDTRPSYREEEAKDAWRRAILFLRERMAPDTLPPDALPAVPDCRPPAGGGGKRRGGGGPWKGRRGRPS